MRLNSTNCFPGGFSIGLYLYLVSRKYCKALGEPPHRPKKIPARMKKELLFQGRHFKFVDCFGHVHNDQIGLGKAKRQG